MAKSGSVFFCTECGGEASKWTGQCGFCRAWNTLIEHKEPKRTGGAAPKTKRGARRAPSANANADVIALNDITLSDGARIGSGLTELDRVLGGGLVHASVILIGGDPGIGKSTILLQCLAKLSNDHKALYVSAEESIEQIAMRAHRIGLGDIGLEVLAENNLDTVLDTARARQPDILVIDSIQTVFTEDSTSAAGSVSQVRDCGQQLVRFAKDSGTIVIMVGHVTKEGHLAGPRILEHMVDTVLYFEGEKHTSFRIIRGVKNRFGTVNEIGVFAMTDRGLKEVNNPSAMFVSGESAASGSSVLITQEGTRSLLVEMQALVDPSQHHNPRRLAIGLDSNRLAMVLAVLNRYAGLTLSSHDVFLNVVGGVRVVEPAADLAMALAIHSSARGWALPPRTAVFGEIGLTGEIRAVQRGQDRIREAEKLGYERVIMPSANLARKHDHTIELIAADHISAVTKRFGG